MYKQDFFATLYLVLTKKVTAAFRRRSSSTDFKVLYGYIFL